MYDDTIENSVNGCRSQPNISSETIKAVCHDLEKNLIEYASPKSMLSRIIKLFLMAEKILHNEAKASYMVESYLQGANKVKTSDVQLENLYPSQTENILWNISAMREIQGRLSSIVDDNELSDCVSVLEKREDPSLGLMLWLFPALATEKRLKTVCGILRKNPRNWTLQDKMLFWLACVQNQSDNRQVIAYVEEQILSIQLDSGAFANVEGKDEDGSVISSAIGLLVLVYCAKLKEPNGSTFGKARETASWIVARLRKEQGVEALSQAWSLYALSEFIHLNMNDWR